MEDFNFITPLGLIAGVLTTIAYLPQLIKTWKTKSAHDLSWSMLIVLCAGIVLWLVYGFYERDIPIIAANIVTFIFAGMILMLKIRYKSTPSEENQSFQDVPQK
jgi:MtN3 and saliva related transmembrane protein